MLSKDKKDEILSQLHHEGHLILKRIEKEIDEFSEVDWHFVQILDFVKIDIEKFLVNTKQHGSKTDG